MYIKNLRYSSICAKTYITTETIMPQCFNFLLDKNTKILIIGTMPGEASLKAGQYYAHPRNCFWRIIADSLNNGVAFSDYKAKTHFLCAHGIGLWDNLKFCYRQGSLDSQIRQEIPNDFESLLPKYPNIKVLLFNGQKSFAFFKKYHPLLLSQISYQILPSTSPANAAMSYAAKLSAWQQALN